MILSSSMNGIGIVEEDAEEEEDSEEEENFQLEVFFIYQAKNYFRWRIQ